MFPLSSQWVTPDVPQAPIVFPNMFSRAPYFLSQMLWQMLSSYIGPKGRNCILQNKTFYFGEPPKFDFFLSDGPIKKKNLNLEVGSGGWSGADRSGAGAELE